MKNCQLVHITSLGCAKNLVDTELAAGSLLTSGFGFSNDPKTADIEFINTCAFIQSAREETFTAITDAVKWKKRRAGRKIVIGGCIVEWDKDGKFRAQFPEVDLWARIDSIAQLGQLIKGAAAPASQTEPRFLYDHNTPRLQLTPSHFAYLKISDGCDNRCNYCSIPLIRGALRSRPMESIVKEAKDLLRNGCKELVVIAQDSGAFGRDRKGSGESLSKLLRALDALKGDFWLRLMYVHPASATDELLETMASAKHLVPCLEMPLQHIADKVLRGMGRKISAAATISVLDRLRKAVPGIGIRTTFMVGFPGETEEDFKELLNFVKTQRFERLGAFSYSPEAGTPAAKMPAQVPSKIAEARRAKLMRLQAKISLERNKLLEGTVLNVIVDELAGRGRALGRTYFDAPEIDNSVQLSGASGLQPGDFAKALVRKAGEYEIEARIVEEQGEKPPK